MIKPWHTLAWTASSAGWFVLAELTQRTQALVVAILCAVVAAACYFVVSQQ